MINMPNKKITENLYLGDQFSNTTEIDHQLMISNIYYDWLLAQKEEKILFHKKDCFVKTETKLALNIYDSHSIGNDWDNIIAAAIIFIKENINKNEIYTHCQLGVSRSASIIFIYLVISKKINSLDFQNSLNSFLDNYYPFMKLNQGMYLFLKENFPFNNILKLLNLTWEELECEK